MRSTVKHQTLIPLSDLYQSEVVAKVNLLPRVEEQADFLAANYGVSVVRDHADRLAVTVEDACKIRDQRKAAEVELLAEQAEHDRATSELVGWQSARDSYWANNWLSVLRATPILGQNPVEHRNRARMVIGQRVLDLETLAGCPAEIQARLGWPALTASYRMPDADDRPEATAYQPPNTEE